MFNTGNEQQSITEKTLTPWILTGLIILPIRFVQGWIFWGGGSRRFIYDPAKLDPYSTSWMANKLQSAMPGALLYMGDIISFLLQHFTLLYLSIIIFSLIELISGLGLLCGFFTRINGLITALISVMLMLIFGWEGSACIDEWTMAVANLSMGLTLALSGSPLYSIDSLLLRHYPRLSQQRWFKCCASGPVSLLILKRASLFFLISTMIFTLATYNYYRGAIFSPYHPGPTSSTTHHITLSDGNLKSNGSVNFIAYVGGGSPAQPSYIIRIELVNNNKDIIETWENKQFTNTITKIDNDYAYNRFALSQYGIIAPVSAKAKIELSPSNLNLNLASGDYILRAYTIDGKRWDLSCSLTSTLSSSLSINGNRNNRF